MRPQNPAVLKQLATPKKKRRNYHDECEIGAQSSHDVIAVEQQRQRLRPLIAGKLIEPLHFSFCSPVDQETQYIIHRDWIVNGLMFFVRLADKHDRRALTGAEQAFHGSDGGGL